MLPATKTYCVSAVINVTYPTVYAARRY